MRTATTCRVAMAPLVLLMMTTSAHALGELGVRGGAGIGFVVSDHDGADQVEVSPIALGAAWVLELGLVEFEVDALWRRTTLSVGEVETVEDYIGVPVLARLSIPIVPLVFSASLGIGIEPRIHLQSEHTIGGQAPGADASFAPYEATVMYLPIVGGLEVDARVARIALDMRYEQQLTEAFSGQGKDRVHSLMFMGGAFF